VSVSADPSGPPGGGPSSTAPGPGTRGAADAGSSVPQTGSPAPPLTLTDQHGQSVTLADYRGDRAVLVVFYPYAFSRVCGSELQALHQAVDEFQNDRVQLLAVSCDALYSLRAYADEAGFAFPLLADHWPHGAAARAYGVFDPERGCAVRGTFLIDRDGIVRWSVVNGMADARDLDDYRTAIAAAGL
jgi:mycoredoxin-dependent peroxiredoxin